MLNLKRAYEKAEASDGARFLVERLWARGMKKEELKMKAWLKDVAPSQGLRKWYGHDAARWEEFRQRYRMELEANPDAWVPILEAAREGDVTLLYSARDMQHNSARVLKEFLEEQMGQYVPARGDRQQRGWHGTPPSPATTPTLSSAGSLYSGTRVPPG